MSHKDYRGKLSKTSMPPGVCQILWTVQVTCSWLEGSRFWESLAGCGGGVTWSRLSEHPGSVSYIGWNNVAWWWREGFIFWWGFGVNWDSCLDQDYHDTLPLLALLLRARWPGSVWKTLGPWEDLGGGRVVGGLRCVSQSMLGLQEKCCFWWSGQAERFWFLGRTWQEPGCMLCQGFHYTLALLVSQVRLKRCEVKWPSFQGGLRGRLGMYPYKGQFCTSSLSVTGPGA